jgi:hypothetical protein
MCGCYVDSSKDILLEIGETFLNLENEEFDKFLNIAKELFSKQIEDKITSAELKEDMWQEDLLQRVRESKLKEPGVLKELYQRIIDTYDYEGHFLILVFHDAYDVMKRTKDNNNLDDSEEVYEYIMCAICPMHLTKPGLGYREDENRIAPRIRDWVVNKPECGFVWPAFEERTTEIDKVMFYHSKPAEPQWNIMENGIGVIPKLTMTQERSRFMDCFAGFTDKKPIESKIALDVCERLDSMQDRTELTDTILTPELLQDVCVKSDISEVVAKRIRDTFEEKFEPDLPKLSHLLSGTIMTHIMERRKKEELREVLQKAVIKIEQTDGEETELSAKLKMAIRQNK